MRVRRLLLSTSRSTPNWLHMYLRLAQTEREMFDERLRFRRCRFHWFHTSAAKSTFLIH